MYSFKGKTLVGTVVNNEDSDEQFRVKVIFKGLTDSVSLAHLPWLTVSQSAGASGNTGLSLPNLGCRVKVFFVGDTIESGIVVGTFTQWTPNSK